MSTGDEGWREDTLRLSEERLAVALRASPATVWNQDRELRYTWVHNPRPGFKASDIIGKTDFDLLPENEAGKLAAIKRRVIETGVGAREVVRTTVGNDTRDYDLTCEPLRDSDGEIVGITCASWDVTPQRQAERLQRLLAEIGTSLIDATPDYRATFSRLAEIAVRELGDWFFLDVIDNNEIRRFCVTCADPADRDLAVAFERLELDRDRPHLTAETLRSEKTVVMTEIPDGYLDSIAQSPEHARLLHGLRARSLVTMPLQVRGTLLGVFALISTRPERRYQEKDCRFLEQIARMAAFAAENAQLYQSAQRAIAARDDVLAMVAHDLRNPLSGILMGAKLVRAGARGRGQDPVELIERAAHRMNRLIGDMVDVARLDAGALAIDTTPLQPVTVVAEAVDAQRAVAGREGVQLRLEIAPVLPEVDGDRGRLLQVFDNLIGNAIRHTPPGGTITVNAHPGPGAVIFSVADTGCGIDPEHLPHLFDRFWQADGGDRHSAGLGMAITRGIVEAHGGTIGVESELGKGTTVSFTIPSQPERAGAGGSSAPHDRRRDR